MFYRWHNVLAARIQKKHPRWRDEDVFQAARRLNIATLQSIIAYEYLPAFLGMELSKYEGYKPDLHPGVSHVFQSAAFRYTTRVRRFAATISFFLLMQVRTHDDPTRNLQTGWRVPLQRGFPGEQGYATLFHVVGRTSEPLLNRFHATLK